MAEKTGKEVATTDTKDLAALEAQLYKGADEAGGDFGMEDLTIPRLVILQSNSPQVDKNEGAYVEGAEAGMIYDTVSGTLFSGEDGIVILPIHYRHSYVEWIPRTSGGGFVADYEISVGQALLDTCEKDDKGHDILPNGNQLVNTMEYIVYLLGQDGPHQAILTMTSTQLRKGKKWNSNIMKPLAPGVPAPFYARAFRFTTVPERNAKGSWFGWNIALECRMVELKSRGYSWCDAQKFNIECAGFRKLLTDGAVKVAPPTSDAGASSDPEVL